MIVKVTGRLPCATIIGFPAEVRDILKRTAGQHLLEYHEVAEAIEWRQSGSREPNATEPASLPAVPVTAG